jgi:Integrase core domain
MVPSPRLAQPISRSRGGFAPSSPSGSLASRSRLGRRSLNAIVRSEGGSRAVSSSSGPASFANDFSDSDRRPPSFVLRPATIINAASMTSFTDQENKVLKSMIAQFASSFCEHLVGTIRRECLDFLLIPLTVRYLREIMSRWITHYNRAQPHCSLRAGLPIFRLMELSSRTVTNCPTAIE